MRRHRSDKIILFLTIGLMLIGLVVIYAIGPQRANFLNTAYGQNNSPNGFFIKQLLSVGLSTAAFIAAFHVPYEKIRIYAKIALLAGIGFSVALLIFGTLHMSLARCELGACRWLNLGPLSFQPAELIKMGLVLYLAQIVAMRKKQKKTEQRENSAKQKENQKRFWLQFGGLSILSIFFVVVVQKDLGSGVPMIAIMLAILWMSGMKVKVFMIIVSVVLLAGVLAIVSTPHRVKRLMTFGNASGADKYHLQNALIAIGTGGFGGVGVSNSVQATGYLPESINDSVFAIMGETFGFVGLTLVIACFGILLLRILKITETAGDDERSLVAVGVFAWIMTHVVINVAAMTGLVPLTGITLPLLSYGGTSMLFVSAALGLMLQFSCYSSRESGNVYKDLSGLKRRRIE